MDMAKTGNGREVQEREDIGLSTRPAQAPSKVLMVDDTPANLADTSPYEILTRLNPLIKKFFI